MALNKEFFGTIKSKGKDGINLIKSKTSEIDLSEIKRSGAEKGKRLKDKTSETTRAIKDKIDEKKDDSKILNADKWLNEAIENYNIAYSVLSNYGVELYTERERAVDSISNIEKLINSIANHPKSFDKDFSVIISQKENFDNVCTIAKEELTNAKKSAVSAGGGLAAGAAVASLAPSAALWVATTFGTASTGTAISALSGAAATNAALAWLGGGAVATGGGGVAAGNALLALAGPIGWTIAGASILTSVVLFTKKKMKSTKEKMEEIEKIKTNTEALKESTTSLKDLLDRTIILREKMMKQYSECMSAFGKDFQSMSEANQMQLITLVNNTKAIASTLDNNI